MNDCRRYNFDHWNNFHRKIHFFNQITIFDNTICRLTKCLLKIIPNKKCRHVPNNKRNITAQVSSFKTKLKNSPNNKHINQRL